jgi:hypothetical protein
MATAAIKRKRKQKPQRAKRQTPQDKHQRNHPMAQGKKTKTPGGQKPQSSKRQPSTTTTERKKNTPACRSPWASKDKRQQQWPADRLQPQPATNTNRCGQKPKSAKRKNNPREAKSNQMLGRTRRLDLERVDPQVLQPTLCNRPTQWQSGNCKVNNWLRQVQKHNLNVDFGHQQQIRIYNKGLPMRFPEGLSIKIDNLTNL